MARGGMCKNPFGGNERLDRIDFCDFASGTDDPYKLLYLKVISDAASDYLFFGLGKNGTVADEFWYAVEYFFHTRSFLPDTWKEARTMEQSYIDEETGKHIETTLTLTDEELAQACFDRHYELSGMDKLMPIDKFLSWLQRRREEIIMKNKEQVDSYIDMLRTEAFQQVANGQIGFSLEAADRMQVLTHPDSPEQVAELIYCVPKRKVSKPVKSRIPSVPVGMLESATRFDQTAFTLS